MGLNVVLLSPQLLLDLAELQQFGALVELLFVFDFSLYIVLN